VDALQQQASAVLAVLSRAREVLGGDGSAAPPTAFAPPREIETGVGRGVFAG
jgi:hypothetical protein